jgi:hypothetical protein
LWQLVRQLAINYAIRKAEALGNESVVHVGAAAETNAMSTENIRVEALHGYRYDFAR